MVLRVRMSTRFKLEMIDYTESYATVCQPIQHLELSLQKLMSLIIEDIANPHRFLCLTGLVADKLGN